MTRVTEQPSLWQEATEADATTTDATPPEPATKPSYIDFHVARLLELGARYNWPRLTYCYAWPSKMRDGRDKWLDVTGVISAGQESYESFIEVALRKVLAWDDIDRAVMSIEVYYHGLYVHGSTEWQEAKDDYQRHWELEHRLFFSRNMEEGKV